MDGPLNKILDSHKKIKTTFLSIYFLLFSWNYLVANMQGKPATTYDTASYFDFSIYPAFRMQIISGIYTLINKYEYILIFQSIITFLTWIFLSFAILYFFKYSWGAIASLLILGAVYASSVVVEHNFMMTSEALNNSALGLFIGATLIYTKKPDLSTAALFSISLFFMAGTKSASSVAALATFIVFVALVGFQKYRSSRKFYLLSTITLLILAFFIATALSSDVTKTLTTSATINNRLWVNVDWREDVLKSGYPSSLRQIWESHKTENLGQPPDGAVVNADEFQLWWESAGKNFLNVFLIQNPDYTILAPICLRCFDSNFNFKDTLISGWAKGTTALLEYPELSEVDIPRGPMWPIETKYAYLFLGIMLLIVLIRLAESLVRRNSKNVEILDFYLLTLTYLITYSYFSWWFGSKPDDVTRHLLAAAIGIRILFVVSLVRYLEIIFNRLRKTLQFEKK